MSTIFTKIISGEIPCHKVYEDDKCFAFLDINPVTKGHTLLVPKEVYPWMSDVPDALLEHLFVQSKVLMKQMKSNLNIEYVYLAVEWLEIPHFHIHLIPNNSQNKARTFTTTTYQPGEAEEIAKKIAWI